MNKTKTCVRSQLAYTLFWRNEFHGSCFVPRPAFVHPNGTVLHEDLCELKDFRGMFDNEEVGIGFLEYRQNRY